MSFRLMGTVSDAIKNSGLPQHNRRPARAPLPNFGNSPLTLIYKRTGNLRAVQLLLGHTKIESTVRYLGIEADDALDIAEQVDV